MAATAHTVALVANTCEGGDPSERAHPIITTAQTTICACRADAAYHCKGLFWWRERELRRRPTLLFPLRANSIGNNAKSKSCVVLDDKVKKKQQALLGGYGRREKCTVTDK